MKQLYRAALLMAVGAAALAAAGLASADHSWGDPPYHWGRTSNPFTLQIVDSMTSSWDTILSDVSTDWSQSSVLDTNIVAGDSSQKARKSCKPVSGKIRACNANYGFTRWIGLATIWTSGGHIVQATAKMNESYFALSQYNDLTKKQSVACMEVGHDLGLDHNDNGPVGGTPDTTCMNDDEWYPSPNDHDYVQLETIYDDHTDSSNTYSTSLAGSGGPGNSGQAEDALPPGAGPRDGTRFVRDLGDGRAVISYVVWADE
jgi:hypothetical protein